MCGLQINNEAIHAACVFLQHGASRRSPRAFQRQKMRERCKRRWSQRTGDAPWFGSVRVEEMREEDALQQQAAQEHNYFLGANFPKPRNRAVYLKNRTKICRE
jgi:hypothetical protein